MSNISDLKEILAKKIDELSIFRLSELVELSGNEADNALIYKKIKVTKRYYLGFLIISVICCGSLFVAWFSREILGKDIVNWSYSGLLIFQCLCYLIACWGFNIRLERLKTIVFLMALKAKLE